MIRNIYIEEESLLLSLYKPHWVNTFASTYALFSFNVKTGQCQLKITEIGHYSAPITYEVVCYQSLSD